TETTGSGTWTIATGRNDGTCGSGDRGTVVGPGATTFGSRTRAVAPGISTLAGSTRTTETTEDSRSRTPGRRSRCGGPGAATPAREAPGTTGHAEAHASQFVKVSTRRPPRQTSVP